MNGKNNLIALRDVAHLPWLPRRRAGSNLGYATLWRWMKVGVKGVRLRVVRVGITPCTTEEWLIEFFEAVEAARNAGSAPFRTPYRRQRQIESAEQRLSSKGFDGAIIAEPNQNCLPTQTPHR
jgi:hypothetical protein